MSSPSLEVFKPTMTDYLAGMQLGETGQDERVPQNCGFHSGRRMASSVSYLIIFAQRDTHSRGETPRKGVGVEGERDIHREKRGLRIRRGERGELTPKAKESPHKPRREEIHTRAFCHLNCYRGKTESKTLTIS